MLERNAPPLRVRTVFISDTHLGFKGCSADLLLDFLQHVEMDCLFLVGDIIDVWSMQKSMFWPQSHNNVLRAILGKAKRGIKVIFVPGGRFSSPSILFCISAATEPRSRSSTFAFMSITRATV